MSTIQTSRSATDPKKHYRGVLLQQGRVLYDDDWNENVALDAEAERRALIDVIGPVGSPDDGFRISDATVVSGDVDFQIAPGTLYVGGLRVVLEEVERYVLQKDWLEQPPGERAPSTTPRFDLIYLEVWEQPVLAVEDSELFEVALGGADTSARVRTTRRVRILRDVPADCELAWSELVQRFSSEGRGVVDSTNELVTDARIKVDFDLAGVSADLCKPSALGGYLGAENQTLRVELLGPDRFTWGYDNASPLYRATLDAAGATVTLRTLPKDETLWPVAGQVVEILPWGAILPNGEKVAEARGHLSRVLGSFSPDTRELVLETPVPAGFGEEWKARSDAAVVSETIVEDGEVDVTPFYYVRVWDRGADRTSEPLLPFTAGVPTALAETGLFVTFTGNHLRAGDHWIIAARPDTPHQFVPWNLTTGRAPHGVRTFIAPLALLAWTGTPGSVTPVVDHDCRTLFEPLTRLRGCCTFTVGDGVSSHGRFATIQEAVDHLPPSGGEICVLAGRHPGPVRLQGRRDVVIHGCGERSVLHSDDGSGAALTIQGSTGIRICDLRIEAEGHAIVIGRSPPVGNALEGVPSADVALVDLSIAIGLRSAVRARHVRGLLVERCDISATGSIEPLATLPSTYGWPAVFALGERLRIVHNRVRAAGRKGSFIPLGGVQIGGGSRDAIVSDNEIEGGNGYGVALGSLALVPKKTFPDLVLNPLLLESLSAALPSFWGKLTFIDGCIVVLPDPPAEPTGPDGVVFVSVSEGPVTGVRIDGNRILDMGGSGISVASFTDLGKGAGQRAVVLRDVVIAGNDIERCATLDLPEVSEALARAYGAGGVALTFATDVTIRENRIRNCGAHPGDPICGVFVLHGARLAVEQNHIESNGMTGTPSKPLRLGHRGAVVAVAAGVPAPSAVSVSNGAAKPERDAAALVVGANVLTSGAGAAIWLAGTGAMHVHDNAVRVEGNADPASILRGNLGGNNPLTAPLHAFGVGAGAAAFVQNLGRTLDFAALAGKGPVFPGGVGFHDNLVDWRARARELPAASTVALVSTGDLTLQGTELRSLSPRLFRPLTDVAIFALSARMSNNRVEEGPEAPVVSSVQFAALSAASDNQSTRCLFVVGHPALLVREGNRSLAALLGGGCNPVNVLADAYAALLFQ